MEEYHSSQNDTSIISMNYLPSMGKQSFYEWQEKDYVVDFFWERAEQKSKITSELGASLYSKEDTEKMDIFNNSDLWEKIFKEKKYTFTKDYSEKKMLWKFTIPIVEVKEEIAIATKNGYVLITNQSKSENPECLSGILKNYQLDNIEVSNEMTGDLEFWIDPHTKLITRMSLPHPLSIKVNYSGEACNEPEIKATVNYDQQYSINGIATIVRLELTQEWTERLTYPALLFE